MTFNVQVQHFNTFLSQSLFFSVADSARNYVMELVSDSTRKLVTL